MAAAGPLLASAAFPEHARDPRAWAATEVDPGPFPKHFRDPRGRAHLLVSKPERIVSNVLAADEILLELVPENRLSGVTYLVDDPTSTVIRVSASVQRVSGAVESTLALAPQQIFVADYTSAETTTQLMAAGAAVVRLHPVATFGDVVRNIELVGRAVGEEPRARALADSLKARLRQIRKRVGPPLRVLVWGFGNTYGEGCLQDDMVASAGGRNLARELGLRGVSALSAESVLVANPDLVVVTTSDKEPRWGAREKLAGAVWDAVPAVSRGRVLALPAAWLGSVTHHGVLAVEALAKALTR